MDIHKYIKKLNKVSHFGLLVIGFVVGLAVMYFYFQPKFNGYTAKEWENNYNQAFSDGIKNGETTYYNLGHQSGCVEGLVVSGVFMSTQGWLNQHNPLNSKIIIEKLTNPYQATIDQKQLDTLDETYKYQQGIITNCEKPVHM
jgi:hypothetical protein